MVPFYDDTLLIVGILAIQWWNLRKIPTGNDLNQMVKCECSLHKGKDEKLIISDRWDAIWNGNGNNENINGGHGRTKWWSMST